MTSKNNEKYTSEWTFEDGYAKFYGNGYGASSSLYTGEIELPEGKKINLSFKYSGGGYAYGQKLTVFVNANDGLNELQTVDVNSTEYQSTTLSLDEYAGQTVQVAFKGAAGYGYYIHLTDIEIEEADENGIEDIVADGAEGEAVYYDLMGRRVANPAAGMIVIKTQNGKATKMVVK